MIAAEREYNSRIRDGLIENGLLDWMDEIVEKLPDEVELQEEIIYFIHNCLIKRSWPLISKVMPGIFTLCTVFLKLSDLFPFEQSKPEDVWKEEKVSMCLVLILNSFCSVIGHNQNLFRQMAIRFHFH